MTICSWQLGLVALALMPFILIAEIVEFKVRDYDALLDTNLMEEAGKVSLMTFTINKCLSHTQTATEAISNMRTVQYLTAENKFYNDYHRHLQVPYRLLAIEKYTTKNSFQTRRKTGGCSCTGHCLRLLNLLLLLSSNHLHWRVDGDATVDSALGYIPVNVCIGHFSERILDHFSVLYSILFCTWAMGFAASYFPEFFKAKLSAGLIFKILGTKSKIDPSSDAGMRQVGRDDLKTTQEQLL